MKHNRDLRVGIVGCGTISRAHAKAYQKAAGVRLALVFDAHRPAAEKLAAETGATVADSLESMSRPGALDAVSICTPPNLHLEQCVAFARAGIAVLCEKPMERDAARAARLAAAVARCRVPFMVAYCHRFHPPVRKAKELLEAGAIGLPILFRNTFAMYYPLAGNHRADPKVSGGGCVMDNGSHAVDLYRYLCGEVKAVQAQIGNLVQKTAVEDFGALLLLGRGGCQGEILLSYSTHRAENYVEIYGTKGKLAISYWIKGRPDLTLWVEGDAEPRAVELAEQPDRFAAEVAHFLDCVRSGRQPLIHAREGLATARVIAAAYAAAKSGRRTAVR